jgi:hypothetical protein
VEKKFIHIYVNKYVSRKQVIFGDDYWYMDSEIMDKSWGNVLKSKSVTDTSFYNNAYKNLTYCFRGVDLSSEFR